MVTVLAAGVFLRLVQVQVFKARELRRRAENQYRTRVALQPSRGIIYDRTGHPLTENLGDWLSIGTNPLHVTNPAGLARDLARVTGKPAAYFRDKLQRQNRYVVLARQVSPEQAGRLRQMGWNFHTRPEIRRVYPQGTLAGQVIGFTDIDNRGISGLELSLDQVLHGREGWQVFQLDVEGRQHLDDDLPSVPQVDGSDVITTLDIALQSVLEEELQPALEYYHGDRAGGLIIDPTTGEILAMASAPPFDPNRADAQPTQRQKNLPVTDLFEPGSAFKPVAASLLLEKGLARPDTRVHCNNGSIRVFNRVIRDAHPYGELDFRDVVVFSSNIGMIKLSQKLRPGELYRRINDLGFLGRTGIELTGESVGSMPPPGKWSGLTKPNVVIGQGISVTMLQLAMCYAAIANDGVLMQPTLVRAIRDEDGRLHRQNPLARRRVMTKAVADTLTGFLKDVVRRGTGRRAAVEGLDIAGKTGTSQLVNEATRAYYEDRFAATFVGFFPADEPRYLVAITVIDPQGEGGEHQGGNVAAPLFANIARRILGLHPELRGESARRFPDLRDTVRVPNLTFGEIQEASAAAAQAGLSLKVHGTGEVVYDQNPPAGSSAFRGGQVHVTVGPRRQAKGATLITPVLTGLSLRDAIRKATEHGLSVRVSGSGRVIEQTPSSGARVTVGDLCLLKASDR